MKEKECREISELHPTVREMAKELMARCEKAGIPAKIGETYRTRNRQDELYAQGRTTPGKIVTHAKGNTMSSYHQWRLAFDVFINIKGKEYDRVLLEQVGQLGEAIGLEWGGRWQTFPDSPHFQFTGGLTIQDLKQGRTLEDFGKGVVRQIEMCINDELRQVNSMEIDGHHYVKLQDLRTSRLAVAYDSVKKCPVLKIVG